MTRRAPRAILFFALLALVGCLTRTAFAEKTRVVLWHPQRGEERAVLEALLRRYEALHPDVEVVPLAVPDGPFKDKLTRFVSRGAGPDVFIRPHNEIGQLWAKHVLRPIALSELPAATSRYEDGLLLEVPGAPQVFGVPLGYKALVAFYAKTFLPLGPPADFADLAGVRAAMPRDAFPLVYQAGSFFFHSPFFLAKGGEIERDDRFTLFDGPARATFDLPATWRREGILPTELGYNDAVRLFETKRAALLINGPWYTPAGDITDDWDVAPLPAFEGQAAGSFVTVDCAFLSTSARAPEAARELMRFLGGEAGQAERLRALNIPPVFRDIEGQAGPDTRAAHLLAALRHALRHGMVTPWTRTMGSVWNPADDVLKASVAQRDVAAEIERSRRLLDATRASPTPSDGSRAIGIALTVILFLGVALLVRRVRADLRDPAAARARLLGAYGRGALPFLAPGAIAVVLLVFAPAIVAASMSLFSFGDQGATFVGLQNFRDILFPDGGWFAPRSFYFALVVTIAWTLANVVLHVGLGVTIALLLRGPATRLRTLARVLLVLPWAVPNYITSMAWKGMFHAQVGAINHLLAPFGFENFNWFERFPTAFFANVITNTWLGFPFMMVVTLGALANLPPELEEASILDGASYWQRLRYVVFPHLRPALVPSILLGSVWTFNMFNVVYLVSGGEPGSQTDILVSEAYRWAFERGDRYGYAAAYSVLIFVFLAFYGRVTDRDRRRAAGSEP